MADADANLHSQLHFTSTTRCEAFAPNRLRITKCMDCMHAIDAHAPDAVSTSHIEAVLAARSPANAIFSFPPAGPEGKGGTLFLGGFRACTRAPLEEMGIRGVVNTAHKLESFFVKWGNGLDDVLSDLDIELHRVPWVDDPEHEIDDADVDAAVLFLSTLLISGQSVLVHCAQGKSRSTTLTLAAMMLLDPSISLQDALSIVQSSRPLAQPNPGFLSYLSSLQDSPTRPTRSSTLWAHLSDSVSDHSDLTAPLFSFHLPH